MKGIGWLDLTVDDAEGLRDFYARVMGWRPQAVDMGEYSDFAMVDPETGEAAGGVCHARGGNADIPPVWLVYFQVTDLDGRLAAVREGGGTVLREPRLAGTSRYAIVRDPAGAVFALAEDAPR
ncbi:MAG: hypothetical protein AMXMBFR53_19460 [Gemmatimonadota bacterium]